MGTRYRVIVEQVEDVEGAQYETRETVLFETVSPSLPSLLRYAPTEVDAALREAAVAAEYEVHPQRVALGIDATATGGLVATVFDHAGQVIGAVGEGEARVDVSAVTPTAGREPEPVAAPTKQRKPRRTKAQIAADEEAARAAGERMQAAVNGSAVQQEQVAEAMALPVTVPAFGPGRGPAYDPTDVTSTSDAGTVTERPVPAEPEAGYMTPDGPVVEQAEPEPGSPAAEVVAAAPAEPVAVPPAGEVWNPFKR